MVKKQNQSMNCGRTKNFLASIFHALILFFAWFLPKTRQFFPTKADLI
jgi:hypothetical protein